MIEDIYQVRIHSRGGQGAKTAGRLIAESVIAQGDFAQAFSEYGPERSGAPMKTFLRLSTKEIRLHGDVENPDMVVVLDPSLLNSEGFLDGLCADGILLINTNKSTEDLVKMFSKQKAQIYAIDASGMAMAMFGKNLPNTVIMGAMAKLLPQVSYQKLAQKTKEHFGGKLSAELLRQNLDILKDGYNAF